MKDEGKLDRRKMEPTAGPLSSQKSAYLARRTLRGYGVPPFGDAPSLRIVERYFFNRRRKRSPRPPMAKAAIVAGSGTAL